MRKCTAYLLALVTLLVCGSLSSAQMLNHRPDRYDVARLDDPQTAVVEKERSLIHEVIEPELVLRVDPTRSKIVRTKLPIARIAISHPGIFDVNEFDTQEIEIIGKELGEATLTMWFPQPDGSNTVLRYLVQVVGDSGEVLRRERKMSELQDRINELFPNSQVQLFAIDNKLIVRGQAHDAKAARDIMTLLGRNYGYGQGGFGNGQGFGPGFNSAIGGAYGRSVANSGDPNSNAANRNRGTQVINLLQVPGVQQVMLKVRVAELSRQGSREIGADLKAVLGSVLLGSLGGTEDVTSILEGDDVQLFIRAVASHGYGKILAEPTLVTVSGQPARFLAGGEFAVPTTVGVNGVAAATTEFRGFGTELEFTPVVLDKDLIRLQVAPSFSSLNSDATVNGIPGLNRRSVNTTVHLREGQWLAIAGLIQDEQGGQRTRLPLLGSLPHIGPLFGNQNTTRNETELIVLVSPELVHPMEAEEVPLQLPGMEVTDPTDCDFFCRSMIEGYAGFDHRSTVWPEVEAQLRGVHKHKPCMKGLASQVPCQTEYVCGPCGLSK